MNHLCDEKITCPGTDNPILNLSSEDPDKNIFLGYFYGWVFPPPLGSQWQAAGCKSLCISEFSQADADICAWLQWWECLINGNPQGPVSPVGGNPIVPTEDTFYNSAQYAAVSCPDGTIFYYTTPAGTFNGPTQDAVDQMALAYAYQRIYQARLCLSTIVGTACKDKVYTEAIGATTKSASVVFALAGGTLPPGVTLTQVSPKVAFLQGTPTTAGNYSIVVRATDPQGVFMQKTYVIAVIGLTNTDPLPEATNGVAYSEQLNAAGGTPPYKYFLDSGTLPDGLTLTEDGLLSGTPTTSGLEGFNIRIQDSTP